ncbi:MAG TPA: type II secretion system F family protein [Candidatus Aenigmarchaeota archaeon]|nr:type II secretion system F family protein [Candidatus Aenigmarchaeota archaeon]
MGFKYCAEAACIITGVVVILLNYIFISNTVPFLVPVLNVFGGLVIIIPPVLLIYTKYRVRKESEKSFIAFIMDLADSINSGMTLPLALQHCSKRGYPVLSKKIKKLAAQVDWGVPFERALQNFAKKTYSPAIKRAVTTIVETYKVGGRISDTLESVTKSMITIDKISEERRSSVYSQTVTLYIIFFVFIAIITAMQVFIIPSLSMENLPNPIATGVSIPQEEMKEMLTYLIVIQGFFAGLVTGKMAEGSTISGIKHSIFLVVAGYLLFSLATQVKIPIVRFG